MPTIPLLCAATHAAIPALVPGDTIGLAGEGAGLHLVVPCTLGILQRLAHALKAGALVIQPGTPGPTLEEIELSVDARHEELMQQIEAFLQRHTTAAA